MKHQDIFNKSSTSHEKLSYSGNGKISVPVSSIVNSDKVQRQVNEVKEMAESQRDNKHK